MKTDYLELTKNDQTESVKKLHLTRKMFYVSHENKVIVSPKTEKSHYAWLVGDLGMTEEEFECIPRGYAMCNNIYFYRGSDFRTDDDLEDLVLELCTENNGAQLWDSLGFNTRDRVDFVEVYCGLIPGKVGERWMPLRLVYHGHGYSSEYFSDRIGHKYMTIADAKIMINRIKMDFPHDKYRNLKIRLSNEFIYISKKDVNKILTIGDIEDIVDRFFSDEIIFKDKYENPVKIGNILSTGVLLRISRNPILNYYTYNPLDEEVVCLKRPEMIVDVELSVGKDTIQLG